MVAPVVDVVDGDNIEEDNGVQQPLLWLPPPPLQTPVDGWLLCRCRASSASTAAADANTDATATMLGTKKGSSMDAYQRCCRWTRQEGGGEDSGAVWGQKSRFHLV
jgi:hypothetical protein